ncbi:MAG: hypothetical protein ABI397_00995 [Candidatus Saccharimonas sp.]
MTTVNEHTVGIDRADEHLINPNHRERKNRKVKVKFMRHYVLCTQGPRGVTKVGLVAGLNVSSFHGLARKAANELLNAFVTAKTSDDIGVVQSSIDLARAELKQRYGWFDTRLPISEQPPIAIAFTAVVPWFTAAVNWISSSDSPNSRR